MEHRLGFGGVETHRRNGREWHCTRTLLPPARYFACEPHIIGVDDGPWDQEEPQRRGQDWLQLPDPGILLLEVPSPR
jgi:hypothetical protein